MSAVIFPEVNELLHVVRRRTGEIHPFVRLWVLEAQCPGVEGLSWACVETFADEKSVVVVCSAS